MAASCWGGSPCPSRLPVKIPTPSSGANGQSLPYRIRSGLEKACRVGSEAGLLVSAVSNQKLARLSRISSKPRPVSAKIAAMIRWEA